MVTGGWGGRGRVDSNRRLLLYSKPSPRRTLSSSFDHPIDPPLRRVCKKVTLDAKTVIHYFYGPGGAATEMPVQKF